MGLDLTNILNVRVIDAHDSRGALELWTVGPTHRLQADNEYDGRNSVLLPTAVYFHYRGTEEFKAVGPLRYEGNGDVGVFIVTDAEGKQYRFESTDRKLAANATEMGILPTSHVVAYD